MAIRQIIKHKADNPILRQKSRPVEVFDDRLGQLIDDLIDTMNYAYGVGLAAPQVGIFKRVYVISVKQGEVFEFVNPVITKTSGTQREKEGCLSIPNTEGETERPAAVTVEAFDRHGKKFSLKGKGLLARAICHETDHLDGILYTDRVSKN
ncbi:MAG: peptide deformylase [Firmicutes bacterium]|nr:peptide deformylase [Bacillota bacterium]